MDRNVTTKKKYGILRGIILILLMLALTGCSDNKNESNNMEKEEFPSELELIYLEDRDETVLILDGELLKDSIPGKANYYDYWTKCIASDIYFFHQDQYIYMLKNKKLTRIVEDAWDRSGEREEYNHWDNLCWFTGYSASGDGLAYRNIDGHIVLYNTVSLEGKVITEEAVDYFCVSPDGKTVLYSGMITGLYLYTDGTSRMLYENTNRDVFNRRTALAVSNDGEHCFALGAYPRNELYHYDASGTEEIICDGYVSGPYSFNLHNTQITYWQDHYDWQEDYDSDVSMLYTYDAVTKENVLGYTYIVGEDANSWRGGFVITARTITGVGAGNYMKYGMPGLTYFTNTQELSTSFYMGEEYNVSVRKNGRLTELTSSYFMNLAEDSQSMYYLNSDKLYYMHIEDEEPTFITEAVGFGVSADRSRIFYFTEEGELYTAQADGSEAKKLDSEVSTENYWEFLNHVGGVLPIVLGNEHIIYSGQNGMTYMCNINGDRTVLEGAEWSTPQRASERTMSYPEMSCILGRNGARFRSLSFLTYEKDGDWYIINSDGELSLLIEGTEE